MNSSIDRLQIILEIRTQDVRVESIFPVVVGVSNREIFQKRSERIVPNPKPSFDTGELREIVVRRIENFVGAVFAEWLKEIRGSLCVESNEWCKRERLPNFPGSLDVASMRKYSEVIPVEPIGGTDNPLSTDKRIQPNTERNLYPLFWQVLHFRKETFLKVDTVKRCGE